MLVHVNVSNPAMTAIRAKRLHKLAMHMDDIAGPGAFQQIIDILGDQRHLMIALPTGDVSTMETSTIRIAIRKLPDHFDPSRITTVLDEIESALTGLNQPRVIYRIDDVEAFERKELREIADGNLGH